MNCSVGKMHHVFIIEKVLQTKICFSYLGTLTMYDGGSMTSPMIGLYCDSTPLDIITTGHEIFVHFYTNPSYTDIGFKLMYNPTSK